MISSNNDGYRPSHYTKEESIKILLNGCLYSLHYSLHACMHACTNRKRCNNAFIS